MRDRHPTYYAVIFSSIHSDNTSEYRATADAMEALAAEQPGYLGFESVREGARGISISYWQDEASIQHWKQQAEHLLAQRRGRDEWYKYYRVRVARVERDYEHGLWPEPKADSEADSD